MFHLALQHHSITEEYGLTKKALEAKYDEYLEYENILTKQKIQDLVEEYKTSENITKEDVTKRISELKSRFNLHRQPT